MSIKRHDEDDDRHERGEEVPCSGQNVQLGPEPLAARAFTEDELNAIPAQEPCLLYVEDGSAEEGVMPKGLVSMIAGAGGAGKSSLAIALMVAAANGGYLFGKQQPGVPYVKNADAGRVLYISLEDPREHVGRRLRNIMRARGLPASTLARIHVVAWNERELAGLPRTLIKFDQRSCGVDDHPLYVRATATLNQGDQPWSLIVVDTFARSAVGDVETNPEAATALLQRLETWTQLRGKPVVLVIHHSRKSGAADKLGKWLDESLSAEAARGSSAILSTVRWLGMLAKLPRSKPDELSRFRGLAKRNIFFEVAKVNGVADDVMPRLHLVFGTYGVLRLAESHERAAVASLLQANGQAPRGRGHATSPAIDEQDELLPPNSN